MKVSELIKELNNMPQDAKVSHLWDGATRTEINVVYFAKSGEVVTADYDQDAYDCADRPTWAPSKYEQTYWSTMENPNEDNS